MDVWYLRLEAAERARLELTEAILRRIIRKFATLDDLLLFAVTLQAVHLITKGDLQRVGCVATATMLTLRPIVAPELMLSYRQRLESRAHVLTYVERLLVEYLEEEGVEVHPALWSGSCFSDLIGARAVDGLVLKLGAVIPQYRTRIAYENVGLPRQRPLEPLDPAWIRAAGAARIVTAVAAAAAVGPPTTPLDRSNQPPLP